MGFHLATNTFARHSINPCECRSTEYFDLTHRISNYFNYFNNLNSVSIILFQSLFIRPHILQWSMGKKVDSVLIKIYIFILSKLFRIIDI